MKESKIPERIINVVSHEAHRYLFKEAVKQAAPEVEVVEMESGEKLMEHLEKTWALPDLIFLDYRVPINNALQVLYQLRLNPITRIIPVIMYSNSTENRDIEATYHNGADLYVYKPLDIEDDTAILKFILLKEWGEHTKPAFDNYVLTAYKAKFLLD